jgi:hypothetical protein
MPKQSLPSGWRKLASNELIETDDLVDYNPFTFKTGAARKTPLSERHACAVEVAHCQSGTKPSAWEKQTRAEDRPMFFRYEAPAVCGGEKKYAELVKLASEWFDPSDGPALRMRSALADEVHCAFLLDSAESGLPQEEFDQAVALYILFYAAAKRCGDI